MTPSYFTSVIDLYLPEPHATLLNGIIFGVSTKTNPTLYTDLKRTGLLHMVVLSGINITILASIIASFTSFLPKKISIVITILMIIGFILFVGPQAPVIRAGFMGIVSLIAILYGRKNTALWTLFLSSLFIAIFWPGWLTTLSMHLSYGATLGIILFGTVNKKTNSIWKELKPSLAAQLFTTPLIFFAFHQISFIAPLANLLTAPLVAPLMIFGLLTAVLGAVHYLLGFLPSLVCFALLSLILFIVEVLSRLPFAFHQF